MIKTINLAINQLKISFSKSLTLCFIMIFILNIGFITGCEIPSSGGTMYFDAEGNGIQVWSELVNDRFVIKSSIYNMDKGWLDSEIISPQDIDCELPILAVDQNWNCVIAWVNVDPTLGYNVLYAMKKLAVDSSWGNPQIISIRDEKVIMNSYRLVIDNKNRILLLWDSLIDVEGPEVFKQLSRSCRSSFDGSWTEPQTVRMYNQGNSKVDNKGKNREKFISDSASQHLTQN